MILRLKGRDYSREPADRPAGTCGHGCVVTTVQMHSLPLLWSVQSRDSKTETKRSKTQYQRLLVNLKESCEF